MDVTGNNSKSAGLLYFLITVDRRAEFPLKNDDHYATDSEPGNSDNEQSDSESETYVIVGSDAADSGPENSDDGSDEFHHFRRVVGNDGIALLPLRDWLFWRMEMKSDSNHLQYHAMVDLTTQDETDCLERRFCAIWRTMCHRDSAKPQDLVFSIMHILDPQKSGIMPLWR
jgi:hypothetical protein